MSRVARIESIAPVRSGARWWTWHRMVGALVVAHGVAHLAGLTDALSAMADDGSVRYFFENWSISGSLSLLLAGSVWAVLGVGLCIVGGWIIRSPEPSMLAQLWVVVLLSGSAVACFVAMPAATTGLVIDVALLATAASLGTSTADRDRRVG